MKGLAITLLIPFLVSCAKMLSLGHENFRCEATEQSGICGPMEEVWQRRKSFMKESWGIDYIREGDKVFIISGKLKRVRICKKEFDVEEGEIKKCRWESKLERKEVKEALDRKLKEIPVPVRRTEWIQRVWIYPYTDKNGNLISGHFIYVVVEKGKWLDEEGREVE